MANKIQIKRSTSNSTVTGLSNGELAFTQAGNTLHIGLPDGSGVLRIGGAQYPGTLTNSHALVANSTGGIDKIIVANAVVTAITANGSLGTAGYYLTSNGTASYWSEPSAGVAGSNTQVQYNDSGSLAGDADFTWNNTTNTLSATNIAGNGASITSVNAATVGGNTASDLRSYADTQAGTAYSNATSYADTAAGTAYSNATSYADSAAATAYSNATSYADTAAGTAYSNATSYADTAAGTAYTNAVSTAATDATNKAANAYSNATSYADTAAGTAYSNATSYADTAAGTAYSNATSYADTAAGTAYSNATSYADTAAGTAYSNAMSDTLSRNGTYTGNNTFQGTTTTLSSNLVISNFISSNAMPAANNTYHIGNNSLRWAQVHAANLHAVTGTFDGNVNIAGDLNVAGNVVTTNVSSVIVSDPMIYLAGNNYTSDLVDIGLSGNYNDGTNRHTGIFRDHTDGVWKIFYNLTQELDANNDVDTADPTYRIATLQTYLDSSGITTNSSVTNITANSTVSVAIIANTLNLSTALAGTYGGTGKSTMTSQAILVGNTTNGYGELTLGTSGYVLQSNGTALVYDVLDGGTF